MRKINLRKRLIGYSAMTSAFILMNDKIDAQIVYTDIDPDTILNFFTGEVIELDINDDEITDITFHGNSMNIGYAIYLYDAYAQAGDGLFFATSIKSAFTLYTSSFGVSCNFSETNAIVPFEEGIEINNSLNWGTATLLFSDVKCGIGTFKDFGVLGFDWYDDEYKYIGLKFTATENYFGWVRVRYYAHKFIIDSYAYSTIAGDPIETSLEIINSIDPVDLNSENNIYYNSGFVNISIQDLLEVKIYDISGKLVLLESNSGQSLKIPFSYARGMYIVEVKTGKEIITKKIIAD